MVRAKFKCVSKEPSHGLDSSQPGAAVRLEAVIADGCMENKAFFDLTPAGVLTMATINGRAAAHFAVGTEYYVDITAIE